MTDLKGFARQQRGVAVRMAAAFCVTALVVVTCLFWRASHSALPERLIVLAKADVFVVAWLAATIANVARLRFFSVRDIAGSSSGTVTPPVGRAGAVLQNTLEQVALALPVHAALAVLVAWSIPLIVALAVLFSLGRLLFWIGYARGAEARAFGFALTFYPSMVGLMVAAWVAVGA